jgi:putative endonuclease
MEKAFAVYIMANIKLGAMYVGVTSMLDSRTAQHREGLIEGFTKRCKLKKLVWFRWYGTADAAIYFEKQLKRWRREWKFRLIEAQNPDWDDLYPELMGWDIIGPLSHLQGR